MLALKSMTSQDFMSMSNTTNTDRVIKKQMRFFSTKKGCNVAGLVD